MDSLSSGESPHLVLIFILVGKDHIHLGLTQHKLWGRFELLDIWKVLKEHVVKIMDPSIIYIIKYTTSTSTFK